MASRRIGQMYHFCALTNGISGATNKNGNSDSVLMVTEEVRLEWVKPPLQARSQQTLERLLDAVRNQHI